MCDQIGRYPGKCGRCSRSHKRTSHSLSADKACQILIIKLRDELIHGGPAFLYIKKSDTLVSGNRYLLRQLLLSPVIHINSDKRCLLILYKHPAILITEWFHAVKLLIRCKCLLKLLKLHCLSKLKEQTLCCISYAVSYMDSVVSRFKHITVSMACRP